MCVCKMMRLQQCALCRSGNAARKRIDNLRLKEDISERDVHVNVFM